MLYHSRFVIQQTNIYQQIGILENERLTKGNEGRSNKLCLFLVRVPMKRVTHKASSDHSVLAKHSNSDSDQMFAFFHYTIDK